MRTTNVGPLVVFASSLASSSACAANDAEDDTAAVTEASGPATRGTGSVAEAGEGITATATGSAETATTSAGPPEQVLLETTLGDIVIELHHEQAPITVANFVTYVESGFYDGADGMGTTVFHRVVPGFVVQGGGLTAALETKATMPAIVNESDNGLANTRGTLAMARTSALDSATSRCQKPGTSGGSRSPIRTR